MHVGVISPVIVCFLCGWNMLEIVEWFQKWSYKDVKGLFQRAGRRSLTDSTLIEARVALETYALGCLCSVILCMAAPLFTFHQSWRKFCRRLMRSKRFHWVNVVVLILYMKTSIINHQLQLRNPILSIHASHMFLQIYRAPPPDPPENERMLFWKKGPFKKKGISSSKTIGFQQIYLWDIQGGFLSSRIRFSGWSNAPIPLQNPSCKSLVQRPTAAHAVRDPPECGPTLKQFFSSLIFLKKGMIVKVIYLQS